MQTVSFQGVAAAIASRGFCRESFTCPLDHVRQFVRAEATHAAQQAKRFGGVAVEWWLASDSEVLARQMGSHRNETNTLYLEVFREEIKK